MINYDYIETKTRHVFPNPEDIFTQLTHVAIFNKH